MALSSYLAAVHDIVIASACSGAACALCGARRNAHDIVRFSPAGACLACGVGVSPYSSVMPCFSPWGMGLFFLLVDLEVVFPRLQIVTPACH